MQTIQKHLLLSLLLSSSSTFVGAHQSSFFDEMWQEMEEFHQHIEKKIAHARNESPSITIKSEKTGLQIIIPHIALKDRNFEAQFDQDNNLLAISTPTGTVSLHARSLLDKQTYLTATLKQQDQREDKISTYSHSQMAQTIQGEIEMGHAAIEYDSETQELIITIPQRKRSYTKIPVNFKEPKDNT